MCDEEREREREGEITLVKVGSGGSRNLPADLQEKKSKLAIKIFLLKIKDVKVGT